MYQKVAKGGKPEILKGVNDNNLREFIKLCLTFDPEMRPTAAELTQHPFLWFRVGDDKLCRDIMKPRPIKPVMDTISEDESNTMRKQAKAKSKSPELRDPIPHQQQQQQQQSKLKPSGGGGAGASSNASNQQQQQQKSRGNKKKPSRHAGDNNNNSLVVPKHHSTKRHGNSKKSSSSSSSKKIDNTREDVELQKISRQEKLTKIKLMIHQKGKKAIAVTFDFQHHEKPRGVAKEMVRDLSLPRRYVDKVERAIVFAS